MSRDHFEQTPLPVEVTMEERAPDSTRAVSLSTTRHRAKGLLKPVAFLGALTATFVAPSMIDKYEDTQNERERVTLAQVAEAQRITTEGVLTERGTAPELMMAHHSVSSEFFGGKNALEKGNNVANSIAVALNQTHFKTPGAWRLNAEDFVDPEMVTISPDGKSFEFKGVSYSLTQGADREGNAYIVAGQTEAEEDRIRLYAPRLMGAAKQDGSIEGEELQQQAAEVARTNLARFLQPEEAIDEGELAFAAPPYFEPNR